MLRMDSGSRVVFVGDSVTDAGRDYSAVPGGWGFGNGYVNNIHNLLVAVYPDKQIMTINSGVSGDDIELMSQRWRTDVSSYTPEYVSVMIGINDVWRHFDGAFRQAKTHDVEYFEELYSSLLECELATNQNLKKIFIVSPIMFETNFNDPMRALLYDFQLACQRVAAKYDAQYIDVQSEINTYLTVQHSCILSADRVHPNEHGAMLVAHAWLKALGFEWERDSYGR